MCDTIRSVNEDFSVMTGEHSGDGVDAPMQQLHSQSLGHEDHTSENASPSPIQRLHRRSLTPGVSPQPAVSENDVLAASNTQNIGPRRLDTLRRSNESSRSGIAIPSGFTNSGVENTLSSTGRSPEPRAQQGQTLQENQPDISFSVTIDDDDGKKFFEPSQPVRGRVILVLQKPTIILAVKVQVLGIVSAGFQYNLKSLNSSTKVNRSLPFSQSITLFNDSISLYPPSDAIIIGFNLRLMAGRHSWPFSFRIPPIPTLPPSYRSRFGSVRYEAIATLERMSPLYHGYRKLNRSIREYGAAEYRSKAKNIPIARQVVKVEMGVRNVETSEASEAYRTPAEKCTHVEAGTLWWKKGRVELKARIPRSAYGFDEQIPVNFQITNHSADGVSIEGVSIEERATILSSENTNSAAAIAAKGPHTTHRVPFEFLETFPASPTSRITSRTIRLTLPQLLPLSPSVSSPLNMPHNQEVVSALNASFNTSVLDVSHFLVVTARSTVLGSPQVRIELPITLVAIPRTRSLIHMFMSVTGVLDMDRVERAAQRGRHGSVDTLPLYEPRSRLSSDGRVQYEAIANGRFVPNSPTYDPYSDAQSESMEFRHDNNSVISNAPVAEIQSLGCQNGESEVSDVDSAEISLLNESCDAIDDVRFICNSATDQNGASASLSEERNGSFRAVSNEIGTPADSAVDAMSLSTNGRQRNNQQKNQSSNSPLPPDTEQRPPRSRPLSTLNHGIPPRGPSPAYMEARISMESQAGSSTETPPRRLTIAIPSPDPSSRQLAAVRNQMRAVLGNDDPTPEYTPSSLDDRCSALEAAVVVTPVATSPHPFRASSSFSLPTTPTSSRRLNPRALWRVGSTASLNSTRNQIRNSIYGVEARQSQPVSSRSSFFAPDDSSEGEGSAEGGNSVERRVERRASIISIASGSNVTDAAPVSTFRSIARRFSLGSLGGSSVSSQPAVCADSVDGSLAPGRPRWSQGFVTSPGNTSGGGGAGGVGWFGLRKLRSWKKLGGGGVAAASSSVSATSVTTAASNGLTFSAATAVEP